MAGERLYRGLGFLLALVLAGFASRQLSPNVPMALAAPQLPGSGLEQLATAAAAIDAALAKGGSGLTFEAVQRNTLHVKPGGPPITLADPNDPSKVVGTVDSYYVNAMVSRGAVTADAFWMYMRRGPAENEPADFDHAAPIFSVIQRDGDLWRNDGSGWYVTDVSPGMGMDPATARKLAGLLRSLAATDPVEPAVFDGRMLVGLHGTARPSDYPGVIASDGQEFTDGAIDITFWLDEAGRLTRLEARARNVNQKTWDLVSETVVTFGYGSAGDPPEPKPERPRDPAPTSEPEAVQVQP